MSKNNVEQQFKEIVADIFRQPADKVKKTDKFVDDYNAKSIDVIALIAATENRFNIRMTSAEAQENKTVGQAIEFIKNKISK